MNILHRELTIVDPRSKVIPGSRFCAIHNRNRNLNISIVPLKSRAQGTSLFTSAATNQRDCPKVKQVISPGDFPLGELPRVISPPLDDLSPGQRLSVVRVL